ncbi:MAG: hypothetical protein AAF679_12465 [Pseudomonadota bacterium]
MSIPVILVVLAGALALALLYPSMRVIALGIFAVMAALAAIALTSNTGAVAEQEGRVDPAQVVVGDTTIFDDGRVLSITGRVTNQNDTFRLRSFDMRVKMLDCPAEDSPQEECDIIADKTALVRVDIPPEQTRSFSVPFSFTDRPRLEGVAVFDRSIIGTRATQ